MNRRDLTDEEIITSARSFKTRYAWSEANPALYHVARRRGLLPEIWKMLPSGGGPVSAYTDEELIQHAKGFSSRLDWAAHGAKEVAQGLPSHHRVALKRGKDFYQKCCAHMVDMRGKHTPIQYSEEEITASAAKYKHRNDWKEGEPQYYQAAYRRGLMDKVSGHMIPQAHPYSHSNIIYTYEFADHYAYIGQTFQPKVRRILHLMRGPVRDHLLVCPEHSYKVLETGLTALDVGAAERRWQTKYKEDGWMPLWKAKGGGLGTIQVQKWTKENVMAEARKYKTRQEWIDKSQMSYRIAKREGWFDEASAHMPRRVLGVGLGGKASPEAREKQRQAKLGTTQSAAHRAARSDAVRRWWAARRSGTQAESVVSRLLDLK